MPMRLFTPFSLLSLIGLLLFGGLAMLSLLPVFRAADKALEAELNEVAAYTADGFMANLQETLSLAISMSEIVGVQISSQQLAKTQENFLLPESARLMLSTALDINSALVRFSVLDVNGESIALISKENKWKDGFRSPTPMPWPPVALEANKVIAGLDSSSNTLRLAQVMSSYSPKARAGFLYTEIDFTKWLSRENPADGFKKKSVLSNRKLDIKLRSGFSDLSPSGKQSYGYLPKSSYQVRLLRALPPPLAGIELVVELSVDASASRLAAWHSIYMVLCVTFFVWSVVVFGVYFFRKRFVLPLRRMTLELQKVIALEESERSGYQTDSVPRLARLLDQLTVELVKAKQGKVKRLEDTYSELYRTRARLEQIASSAGVVAVSFSRTSGKILYRTSSLLEFMKFCNMIRMQSQSITWRALYRGVSSRDRGSLKDCLRILRRQGHSKMQLLVKGGRGDVRIYELRFRIYKVDGTGLSRIDIIALDNTERALAEQGRAASEERKTAIVNVAPDAFFSILCSGTILEVNPAAEALTGFSNIEMVGMNACDFIFSSGDYSRLKDLWTSRGLACVDRESYTLAISCLSKSGASILVEASAASVAGPAGQEPYVCIYLQDLRQRLSRDIALLRKGRELNEVFDLSPGGIAIFNDRDRLVQINKRLESILAQIDVKFELGCSRELFWFVLNGKSKAIAPHLLRLRLVEGEKAINFISASPLTVKYTERMLSDEYNKNYSTVIYFTDITQEFQLDNLKSGFLATAAHELRTPLAIILGFSELLSDEDYSDDEKKSLAQSIYGNSLRLSFLLGDLLDLAKIESSGGEIFKFDVVHCNDLLRGFLKDITVLSDGTSTYSGHPIKLEISSLGDIKFRVDVLKFERVLHNILSNAAKYSNIESEIIVCARLESQNAKVRLVLEIVDHGIGMTEKELDHAFDRFWRANSSSGFVPGTGLGLSIAREIMAHHDGEINIESQFGHGTTVTLKLPAIVSESVGLN